MENSRIWTGLRPLTPDDLPVYGNLPNFKNVFLNCGHGTKGYSSVGTSKSLTDLFIGKKSQENHEDYSINRFKFKYFL